MFLFRRKGIWSDFDDRRSSGLRFDPGRLCSCRDLGDLLVMETGLDDSRLCLGQESR